MFIIVRKNDNKILCEYNKMFTWEKFDYKLLNKLNKIQIKMFYGKNYAYNYLKNGDTFFGDICSINSIESFFKK